MPYSPIQDLCKTGYSLSYLDEWGVTGWEFRKDRVLALFLLPTPSAYSRFRPTRNCFMEEIIGEAGSNGFFFGLLSVVQLCCGPSYRW